MVKPNSGLTEILPDEIKLTRPYWITTRRELLNLARVRAVWDFLKEIMEREQEVMRGGIPAKKRPKR
jgi:DNA-binding transcriptional LysR family regulator